MRARAACLSDAVRSVRSQPVGFSDTFPQRKSRSACSSRFSCLFSKIALYLSYTSLFYCTSLKCGVCVRTVRCKMCGKIFQTESRQKYLCDDCAYEKKHSSTLSKRICKACGAEFIGGPRASFCPECRKERTAKAQKDYKSRKKAGRSRKIGEIYSCEICGKPYILRGGMQKYCEDCAEKAIQEIDNAQSIQWAKENPETISKNKKIESIKTCIVCGKQFVSKHGEKTCSPDCHNINSDYVHAMYNYRKGKRKSIPDMQHFIYNYYRKLERLKK